MSMLAVADMRPRLLQWQSLILDLDCGTVRASGSLVAVSPADFGLLRLLITRRGIPLSREFIMGSLFGAEHGRDLRQADILVARLRLLLAPSGLGDAIRTVAGRGYALIDIPYVTDRPVECLARAPA